MELGAQRLEIRYGGRPAVEDVRAAVPSGSRVFLGGLAGSGKTTLLKALAGLLRPSSGAVLWEGRDPAALPYAERRAAQGRIAMVFQTDALFDSMTVLQNVMLPLVRRGVRSEEAEARAREILGKVGLQGAADVKPEHLSGGMRKRAGLARAIAPRPDVLLCDDPLAGLDPKTAAQVCALVDAEARERTLVVAAPEPPSELALSRWLWLDDGRLVHDGGANPPLLERRPEASR